MNLKQVIRIIFSGILLISLITSCVKESHIEINTDSITIAKILQPNLLTGKDAVIQSFLPDSNYSNLEYLTTLAWTNAGKFNASRALIEFDLSDIPVQTQIDSASLSLYWTSSGIFTSQTGENAFSIYKITESWQENLVTWNNQPSTSVENIVKVPKSTSEQQSYLDIDVTKFVQSMINNPSENHGFMLKLDEEFPYKLVIVASSDHPDESKHPKLVVYY
jgi:hypothetical protein